MCCVDFVKINNFTEKNISLQEKKSIILFERIMNIKSYTLLGVEINPSTIDVINNFIVYNISKKDKIIIASQNLHSVYLHLKNKKFKEFQRNTIKHVDGMPLILWGKILGYPVKREERVTWVDWMHPLLKLSSDKKFRIFYLGSTEDVVREGERRIKKMYPELNFSAHNGFFDADPESKENSLIVSKINEYHPDILIVGMGMLRQEYWILDNYEKLNATCIITSGAAMEYIAGAVSLPPRWMGRFSLEWLYRLIENPSRFWRRYLVEPQALVGLMIKDIYLHYIRRENIE